MTGACPCCCSTDASWPRVESRPTRWPGRWARASERGPAPADYGRDNIALRQLKLRITSLGRFRISASVDTTGPLEALDYASVDTAVRFASSGYAERCSAG